MGALDHLSDLFDCSGGSSRLRKRRQFQVCFSSQNLHRQKVLIKSRSNKSQVIFNFEVFFFGPENK